MLKKYFIASGIKQSDLADRLGISQAFLSQLLNGRRTPSLELAVRIERLTGGAVPAASWVAPDGEAA